MQELETKMPPHTGLDRRKGRLVNQRWYTKDGVPYFHCVCDCGNTVEIARRIYNSDSVSACPECSQAGLAPNLKAHLPPRNSVEFEGVTLAVFGFDCSARLNAKGRIQLGLSMDRDTFKTLGVDLTVEKNCSAKVPRQLLSDFALLVAKAAGTVRLTEAQWRSLQAPVQADSKCLSGDMEPVARVRAVCRRAGFDFTPEPLEAAAVLAALRWGVDHKWEGQWWELTSRVTEE